MFWDILCSYLLCCSLHTHYVNTCTVLMTLVFQFCHLGLNASCFHPFDGNTTKGRKEDEKRKGRVETSGSQDLEGHTDSDWKRDAKKRVWPPARQPEGEAAGLPVCWDSAAAENSVVRSEFPFPRVSEQAESVNMKLRRSRSRFREISSPQVIGQSYFS